MSETGIEQEDIAPPKWLERLAVIGGTFTLSALAIVFYVFCAAYVALNGTPL